MYESMFVVFIYLFVLSLVGTAILNIIFRFLGKNGYLGNLFPNVRGGIPRAIGIIPFILLCFYFLPGYNSLILIVGIFALFDDVLGRQMIKSLSIEWGQLARGISMILVIVAGLYLGLGISAILIALLIQPVNISDMQPGTTCMVTIIMSIISIILMLAFGVGPVEELPAIYSPLVLLIVCLGYCPLDFSGKIMLGEIGNHSFAIALGISFYIAGGLLGVIALGFVTVCLIAFFRRNTLRMFLSSVLGIRNPTFGDFFMDVLTGGGLGDLFRRLILKDKQYVITDPTLILLGFRRLLFNPYASKNARFNSFKQPKKPRLGKL